MRILHVMAGAREGGAENIMLESVLALQEVETITQCVVTRPDNAFRIRSFQRAGIDVHTASFNKMFKGPTKRVLDRAIRDFQPDIIQYWMGRAGQFAPARYRDISIGWYGGYYKLERFRNCLWHIGLTKDLVRHIREQGVPYEHIGLIHTTADFKGARSVDRASLDTPADAPVALALARLHVKKGLDTLLEAATKLPELYVWIAGDGPLESELKAQCSALGLDGRVRFLGWRNDRDALLAACTLVAFPSRYEPFGTVTVDAWAAGKPLVAADAVGPAAYVKDGINGLLIPKNDADALAAAMKRILDNPDLAHSLVKGGYDTFNKTFTKQAFQQDSLAFYRKIRQHVSS